MVRPITLYGDPSLEIISTEVRRGTEVALISDMFETMHKAGGVGLAGVQIGIPLRIFVIEAHLEKENFHFREVFINPTIIREFGNLVKHPEGCLSIPQIAALVERHESIEIEWWNEKWEYQKKVFDGFAARIIQHEYDHLDGIMFTDKVSPLRKRLLKGKLAAISKGRFEAEYRTILPGQKIR